MISKDIALFLSCCDEIIDRVQVYNEIAMCGNHRKTYKTLTSTISSDSNSSNILIVVYSLNSNNLRSIDEINNINNLNTERDITETNQFLHKLMNKALNKYKCGDYFICCSIKL